MPLKYYVLENIIENRVFAQRANARVSTIFSKVFKTLIKFFLDFFQCYRNIENDVIS